MRIAVITNAFPPEARGGAGVITSDLVDLWREDGHEVRVWTEYASWLKRGVFARLVGHVFFDRRANPCISEVAAWSPDVVVTHNLTGVGWRTGRALKTPTRAWIHVLHDVQMFEPSGQMYDDHVTRWQRVWAWYRRNLFGVPTRIVSPTQWLLDAHKRRGLFFSDVEVIPNPAPKPVPSHSHQKTRTWLFVGRLSEEKGADMIVDLARACPEERFTCIGEGPWRETLSSLKNVICLGAQPREVVQENMTASYAVLVPGRLMENQPTVILEAFAQGVPVVATPVGGVKETVEDGGIVAERKIIAWKQAMRDIRDRENDWKEKAKKRSKAFDSRKIASRWHDLFERGA